MSNYGNIINTEDKQKAEEYLKNVIKAVKMTREGLVLAEYKCKKINKAIAPNDKEEMWSALQEYIRNNQELFRGKYNVVIVMVNEDFYNRLTEKDITEQLNIVIGLIYLNEAIHCAAKETIKSCLKNLLKKTGIFSNREIDRLLL